MQKLHPQVCVDGDKKGCRDRSLSLRITGSNKKMMKMKCFSRFGRLGPECCVNPDLVGEKGSGAMLGKGPQEPVNKPGSPVGRAYRVLARLRMRQLQMAQNGKFVESARYAGRARRLSRFLNKKEL